MSLQSIASYYMNMLPNGNAGEEIPLPQFQVVNQPIQNWNGLCVFQNGVSTIKIQKRVSEDEETMKRVVAHEICHAWAFWKCFVLQELPSTQASDHSSTSAWFRSAKVINSHEGPDFVTEKSDSTYVQIGERTFWVFLEKNNGGLWWAWFPSVNDEVERVLHYRITHCNMHNSVCTILCTNDERFLIPEAKLPKAGRLQDTPDDMVEKIEKALHMNPITLESPQDIKTLISQAKVAKHIKFNKIPLNFLQIFQNGLKYENS